MFTVPHWRLCCQHGTVKFTINILQCGYVCVKSNKLHVPSMIVQKNVINLHSIICSLSNDLELQTNTVLFPDKFEKMHKLDLLW